MRLINTLALLAGLAALAPGHAPAQTVDPAARAALPDAVRQSGVLKAATSLQWPPFDFTGPDGKPDGLDIKLVRALAQRLGLMAEFTDVKFPAIVPGVSTGRFDIGVDQLNDTPDRRRTVQFVDYYNGGYGLLTRQGAPATDVSHLCGHTLALTQGSGQVAMAERVSAECTKAGDQPVTMLYFPNSADTYLAVANGRGDGSALDAELVGEVLDVMKALARTGMTMLVVTHEAGFAREAADTVLILDGGEIIERGPPGVVLSQPAHERTRAFLSRVLAA